MTPMISYGSLSKISRRPRTDGSPLNCFCQNACERTTTFGPPGVSSASVYQRPSCGVTRNTSFSDAVVERLVTGSAGPRPVMTNDPPASPPMAANTWLRVFQSQYFGYEAGQVLHAGCVS